MKMNHIPLRTSSPCVITAVLLAGLELNALAFRGDTNSPLLTPPVQAAGQSAAAQVPSANQVEAAQLAEPVGVTVEWDARLGTPLSVRGRDLGQRQPYSGGKGLAPGGGSYQRDAIAVMDNLARFYRVQDAAQEFAAKPAESDNLGFHHVRLAQTFQGLRVVGGDLIVHFDKSGHAYQVNGSYVPDLQLDVVPQIGITQAVRIAQADLASIGQPGGSLQTNARVVYARNVAPQLAYELTFTYQDPKTGPACWRYWIDARQGSVLFRYNDIKKIAAPTANGTSTAITGNILAGEGGQSVSVNGWHENTDIYYLYSPDLSWMIYNVAISGWPDFNTYAYRTTADWAATDPAEMSLGRNFEIAQSFYRDVMGRQSFDDAGKMARANAHEGIDFVNAYWDGYELYFGDGDGIEATSLAVLDVAGHEYTHAVTQYTSDLIYANESGALNESFSDVMAAAIEFYGQADGRASYPNKVPGAADWLLGEDCWLSSTALRDIRNPRNPVTVGAGNEQPSRYRGKFWYSGTGDNGGVHQNSGVQNFCFYLLSEGGSGTNDGLKYAVTGISITNAQQVAFRALTVYCTPSTDHQGARAAWLSAARDLNTNWVMSVAQAWSAVGVSTRPAITQQPTNVTVLAGTTVSFSVGLSGGEPFSYQWLKDGTPIVGATTNPLTLFSVQTNDAGTYWIVVTNVAGSATSSKATLTVIPSVPLPYALDNNLVWTTDANYPWFGQTVISYDGIASAQSGFVGAGQQTALRTKITGPGTLSFWWQIASPDNTDTLGFGYGSQTLAGISGTTTWERQQYYIPSGSQTLTWLFSKAPFGSTSQDHGWVDQVSYVVGSTAPYFIEQPASQGGLPGTTVTLTAVANGTPTLSYQWLKGGTPITGATSNILALLNFSAPQQGAYSLRVSSSYGSVTSSVAVVMLVPVTAWGNNQFGQTEVPIAATNAIGIAAGGFHSLGLRADGRVLAWGHNFDGQCDVPNTLTNALALAAGAYHSLALTADGRVVAWGANYSGQTTVPAGLSNLVALAAGARHSLALRANGRVVGWGDGTWSQLAIPANLTNAIAIAAAGNHSLALRSDGTVSAWGDNLNSLGDFAGESIVPMGLRNVAAVSSGDSHSLTLQLDGTPTLWGDASAGQLGSSPMPTSFTALSGGAVHTLAIVSNGVVAAWGDNVYNQGSVPGRLAGAIAISAGSYHNLALIGTGPVVGPVLPLPVRVGQQLRFSVVTKRGQVYIMEYKNSLSDSAWTWHSALVGDGSARFFADSPGNASTRYYRLHCP